MEKDEQLQKFFELCKNSSFPHREELLKGIKAGEYLLDSHSDSEISSIQMLDIYRGREEHLSKFKGNHAKRLKQEVSFFVNELEQAIDEEIRSWCFLINESSHYVCFEGINSQKILGCMLTVGKRKVSESEWEKLWNE